MGTEDETNLSMGRRAAAAAGAALVAACIVNPLDVIKTRIQAQAMADSLAGAAKGSSSSSSCTTPWVCRSSTLYERWGITEGPLPIRRTPPFPVPAGWVPAPVTAAATAAATTSAQHAAPSPAVLAALAGAGAPASAGGAACGCVPAPPAAAAAGSSSSSSSCAASFLRGSSGSLHSSSSSSSNSMWEMAKAISRREGLPVLWRGTSASLLIAVPMVGIYMPLYDALLGAWAGSMGGLAPVVSGTAARTAACFCVAPFELLRTRLQASAVAGINLRSAISSLVAEHHAHEAASAASTAAAAAAGGGVHSSSGGSSALLQSPHHQHQLQQQQPARPSVLRAVPRMWTGFSATLVRDVPFSALYWALVEPLRQAMLPRNSHWRPLEALAQHASASSSGRHQRSAASTGGLPAIQQQQQQQHAAQHLHHQQHHHHSQLEILIANLVSGFVAGGLAAGATTPFDVVKTRMQIASPAQAAVYAGGSSGSSSSGSSGSRGGGIKVFAILRDVYAREGVEGLFAGVKPRAFRAAPACGIVISVYELLKSHLTPEDDD